MGGGGTLLETRTERVRLLADDVSTHAPPRTLVQQVRRAYLVERVLAAFEDRLVLIRAPAGFGKTELLAAIWRSLRRRGHLAVWLTMARGWSRSDVLVALGRALGAEPDRVIEALSARSERSPVYILVDQADEIGASASTVDWIVDVLSDRVKVAIAGRDIPPLRLSKLRMRGLLAEFDHADLAFARGEVVQVLGHWLRPEEVERLGETILGWPAMVQLCAQVLARSRGDAEVGLLYEGAHPVLRDFVLEEVLPALRPTELAVLCACRDLQDFTLEIAVDLAGLPRTPETLRLVETMPPLLLAQGQRRGWFRPHPVVAAALAAVRGEDVADCRTRHRKASELFAEGGQLEKAVLHASIAGDYVLAVRTIEAAGGADLFLRAGYTVLQGIIRSMPHEVVLGNPSLRLCRCVTLAKSGLIREARAVIEELASDTQSRAVAPDPRLLALLEHLSCLMNVYEDEGLDETGIAALEAKAEAARQEETWRLGWVHNNLAIAYTRSDRLEAAQAHAIRALACYQEERSSYPQVFMHIHLAFIGYRANRIDAALSHGVAAEELIGSRQWNDANLLAIAQVPLAAVRYAQGDVAAARRALERAMPAMASGEGWVDFFAEGYAVLARARLWEDGWTAARAALDEAYAVADARALARLRLSIAILEVELLTRDGQIEAAKAAMRQLPRNLREDAVATPRERDEAELTAARLVLRSGDPEAALALLESLVARWRGALERQELSLRGNLLVVEAAHAVRDVPRAIAALQAAAEHAHPGDQIQQVHDEGPSLMDAIRAVVRRTGVSRLTPTTSQFVSRIASRRAPGATNGILSPREIQILALLDEGMSNKAMARRLDVAEPTVKFHLKNLYSKLGVSRRTLALSVARANGLLGS